MVSETSWLERVLIALSENDLNLLSKYNSTLTTKLHSASFIFGCQEKTV